MPWLKLILGLQILLGLWAIFLSGLFWPFKIALGLGVILCSRIPSKAHAQSPTIVSSWGVFYQGIAYFPHQFKSARAYHDFLLRLRFYKKDDTETRR